MPENFKIINSTDFVAMIDRAQEQTEVIEVEPNISKESLIQDNRS